MNLSEHAAVQKLMDRIEKAAKVMEEKAAIKSHPVTWVKLDRYLELSGDTMDAVQARRKTGKWLDGDQCKMVDGRLWINLPAVDKWVEKWGTITPIRSASSYAKASKASR